ncbi:acyltransferase [Paraburkholderia sp. Tr-20389]|uniref:acyltransferase family protein n=1 Tax=Paraburkholderia sp. Tr-20389 TaxID=2703903 RepID=UPI0019808010|nr:acyltransferase [Paraburkholderia sp. Tr-20389]MBN3753262.1 acyltransferase [Paraburkholderia sp. Tr-20389]
MQASQFPLWSACLTTVACFMVAGQAARHSRFFRAAIEGLGNGRRYGELDGLRAILAFAVFLTHAASSIVWYRTGAWVWPDSTIYTLCGRVPVALFFMITGFLFSHKLMMSRKPIAWRRLYVSRLRRLAPLYLFVTAMMFVVVGQKTGWVLQVSPAELVRAAAKWLSLGVLAHVDLNGLPQSWLLNTAMWTLRYEWVFYALLPLLALLMTIRRFCAVTAVVLVLVYGVRVLDAVSVNFLFGTAAAFIYARQPTFRNLEKPFAAVAALVTLCATALPFARDYGVLQSLLVFPVFMCALYNNSFFGLLSRPSFQILGLTSYSVYLNHGVVLYAGLQLANRVLPVAQMDAIVYGGVVLAIGLSMTCISLLTFRYIEHPFMANSQGADRPAAATSVV